MKEVATAAVVNENGELVGSSYLMTMNFKLLADGPSDLSVYDLVIPDSTGSAMKGSYSEGVLVTASTTQ